MYIDPRTLGADSRPFVHEAAMHKESCKGSKEVFQRGYQHYPVQIVSTDPIVCSMSFVFRISTNPFPL